jgi:hypothetical protein
MAEAETDDKGKISLTIVPTGNILLKEIYSDKDITSNLDYKIFLRGQDSDKDDLKFVINDSLTERYPLQVGDTSDYDVGPTNKPLPNLENHVKITMAGVYKVFSNFWEVVS